MRPSATLIKAFGYFGVALSFGLFQAALSQNATAAPEPTATMRFWTQYCCYLSQRETAHRRPGARHGGYREHRQGRRNLGKSDRQIGRGRDAAARAAATGFRSVPCILKLARNVSGSCRGSCPPIPAEFRSIVSIKPNTPTLFGICSHSTLTTTRS